ncbi:MAG: hypothetical protein HYY45_20080 [Deltaproteobacteria bacterium]|nr:hypothetical protein [Deltaproteobacteria bacterium]
MSSQKFTQLHKCPYDINTDLNSQVAIQVSIQIVRAFIRLREAVASHKDLARRLDEIEKNYDAQFKVVFDAIRNLSSYSLFDPCAAGQMGRVPT